MAFPAHDILRGSVFEPLDAPDVYIRQTGARDVFTTFTKTPGVWRLLYRLSGAELQAWETHYDADPYASDTITIDGDAFTCYYDSPPTSQRLAPDLYDVTVVLRVAT